MGKLTPEIRKKITDHILDYMKVIDRSGWNLNYYKKKFSDMSDKQFEDYIKWLEKDYDNNFYVHMTPYDDKETNLTDIKKGIKVVGSSLTETIWFPHLNVGGPPIKSRNRVVTGPLLMKRPQQYEKKKNKLASDISKRDMFGQVTGNSKGSKFSNVDVFAAMAVGSEDITKELLGFRADNLKTKRQAYDMARETGMIDMNDLEDDIIDHTSLNVYYWYTLCSGYMVDVLGTDYLLPHADITRYGDRIDK